MNRPRVVVFDLGNVLIHWDRRLLFEKVITEPDELDFFLDNIYTMEANQRLDQGTPLTRIVADLIEQHPDHADAIAELGERWIETIGGEIPGTVDLLEQLARRWVPLYALSNWGADTFEMVAADYPFLALFDGLVISGREGVTKPDAAIFELMCDRHGFRPEHAVFIDDSAVNITAAENLGFDTILFQDADRLRTELSRRELL